MRKKALPIIIIFFVFTFSKCQNNKLTVEDIWNKHLASYGEKENVLSVKSTVSKAILKSEMGNSEILIKLQYPDKVFQEITYPNNSKVTFILNGKKGIIKYPNGIDTMSVKEVLGFTQIALIYSGFYYLEYGYQIELIGVKKESNKEYYEIKVITPYEKLTYLIDNKTFEVHKIIRDNSIYEVIETVRINGVLTVKKSNMIFEDETIRSENIEIQHNIELNEAIFKLN